MLRFFAAFLLLAAAVFAATMKLYLKDGNYHLVREYQVLEDRVRYYSTERGDWEEMPLNLVDLKRTEAENTQKQDALKKEAAEVAAEDKFERQQREEVEKIPYETGAFLVAGQDLKVLKQSDLKMVNNKRRSLLKAVSPVPLISGKATIELDGERSQTVVATDAPEFYIRLNAEERFGIVRLTPKKETRVVQRLTIIPVSKEIVEEQDDVEVFRKQIGDMLYKIWPMKPLQPGEYAVVEYTTGKNNVQVWDFSCRPASK
jgi:hypothetical protein